MCRLLRVNEDLPAQSVHHHISAQRHQFNRTGTSALANVHKDHCQCQNGQVAQGKISPSPLYTSCARQIHYHSPSLFHPPSSHTMSDEAFPNAEELFAQAVTSPNPLESILDLLHKHPTHDAVLELVVAYTGAVETNPALGPTLASALSQIGDYQPSPDAAAIPLGGILNETLADHHFKWIGCRDGPHTWGPENRHLLESYLSGLSLKHNLTTTGDMLTEVERGLDATPQTPHAQEVVVGACIQLLLAGSSFTSEAEAGTYKKTPQEIAAKLKAQEQSGVVKEPNAARILNLTIKHAENGFEEAVTEDVFATLFSA
ncbi:hypothetical protein BKA70DRAFT_1287291 [Coprinopsis sp. MPI-PUGE-AT-0042]|nr:hypothetical protein BKA70DRAFT_1287291 [Coprinopsis sp. MPI-PUGE-AT-0042]